VLSAALPDAGIDRESVAEAVIGGVPYVTFKAGELSQRDAGLLANLSALYALFESPGPPERAAAAVPLRRLDRYDDDLLTILKYPGKTNEQFTKLLLNVTLASSAFAGDLAAPGGRRLAVLDPLCGRGTTLNQALMYGFDAYAPTSTRGTSRRTRCSSALAQGQRLKHQADFARCGATSKVVAGGPEGGKFAATKD